MIWRFHPGFICFVECIILLFQQFEVTENIRHAVRHSDASGGRLLQILVMPGVQLVSAVVTLHVVLFQVMKNL